MPADLERAKIEHLLNHSLLGRIGCHANNKTYIVPICYAYQDNCIYCRTYEGMKLNIMRENPQVCFEVEHLETMATWQAVICWGEFEELTEPGKRNKGIEILQNRVQATIGDMTLRISAYWPFASQQVDHVAGVIFCIHIKEKTGKFENS